MIEREIEVFRAGRSSRGITAKDLAEVADFDCETNPIGICFGHPKNDDPAAGTIAGFRAEGDTLFAKIKTLTEKAVEGIKNSEWLNRSMAFFHPTDEANPTPGKWAPRHLGLLGASAPGIPGMAPLKQALAFDAEGGLITTEAPADALIFGGEPTPVHFVFDSKEKLIMADEKTAEQIAAETAELAAARQKLADERTAFEATVKTTFEAANKNLIAGLVTAGKVLPAEVEELTLVFNALDREELTFGAGDKATKSTATAALAGFLDKAISKRVPVGPRTSPATQFNAADEDMDAGDITAAATALMKERPSLSFDAAVEAVEKRRAAA